MKGTFKSLASNFFPWKDLERNNFPQKELESNVLILKNLQDLESNPFSLTQGMHVAE